MIRPLDVDTAVFRAGEVLVDPDATKRTTYLVVHGTADVEVDGRWLGLVSPGDVVGCGSQLDPRARVTARSRVVVSVPSDGDSSSARTIASHISSNGVVLST